MNKPIRVLLCDDSSVVRRLIKSAMGSVKEIDIIGEASNGLEGVERAVELNPDVIIMDVEMPVMDGIDAVRLLRGKRLKTPVIMFSSLTSRGAEATLDAIDAGANDFATKPTKSGHVKNALEHVQNELVPIVRRWGTAGRRQPLLPRVSKPVVDRGPTQNPQTPPAANGKSSVVASNTGKPRPAEPRRSKAPTLHLGPVTAIGIGISTGGPAALTDLFKAMPAEFSIPVLIVQHMPAVFTKRLAERLAKIKGHNVREAEDGGAVVPGDILIAPGDYHMTVKRSGTDLITVLDQSPKINSCRPAVDPLFTSLAEHLGRKSVGIVMTGMGKDGVDGVVAMKKKGSKIIVQDEASSVVWGMPGAVANEGLADQILDIEQIANQMVRCCGTLQPTAI